MELVIASAAVAKGFSGYLASLIKSLDQVCTACYHSLTPHQLASIAMIVYSIQWLLAYFVRLAHLHTSANSREPCMRTRLAAGTDIAALVSFVCCLLL